MFIRRTLSRFVLPLLLVGVPWLHSCGPCHCPASSITLSVNASADGGVVSNVDAFLMAAGAPSGQGEQGNCTANSNATNCLWYAGSLDAGSYSIRVAAPGFQTANVAATVSKFVGNPGASCSCPGATLSPDSVTLMPQDAGP